MRICDAFLDQSFMRKEEEHVREQFDLFESIERTFSSLSCLFLAYSNFNVVKQLKLTIHQKMSQVIANEPPYGALYATDIPIKCKYCGNIVDKVS